VRGARDSFTVVQAAFLPTTKRRVQHELEMSTVFLGRPPALLRIRAGLEKESAGHVRCDRARGDRPGRAFVFQEQSIFPWMSVRDNVADGRGCADSEQALDEPCATISTAWGRVTSRGPIRTS
jgi:hypothetical protein